MPKLIIPLLSMFILTSIAYAQEKAEFMQIEVRSLRLWDSTLNVSEVELVKVLDDINDVIAELGYPGAGYFLWKVQKDTIMQHRYMMLSSWPDKAAYDSIHKSEDYKSVQGKHKEFFEPMRKASFYRRYELVK